MIHLLKLQLLIIKYGSNSHNFKLGWSFWLMGIIIATSVASYAESGILVWKDQPFHRDATANAALYSGAELVGPVMQFRIGSQRKTFTSGQYYRSIAFTESATIQYTDESHTNVLRQSYRELAAFSNQFPKAAPLLAERLQRMEAILKGLDEGMVYYKSRWMPRTEYEVTADMEQKYIVAQKEILSKQQGGRKTAALIGLGVFVLALIVALILRKWTFVGLLLIIPLVAAAGLTYHFGSYGWTKDIPKYIEIPVSAQPYVQKYLDKLNTPK